MLFIVGHGLDNIETCAPCIWIKSAIGSLARGGEGDTSGYAHSFTALQRATQVSTKTGRQDVERQKQRHLERARAINKDNENADERCPWDSVEAIAALDMRRAISVELGAIVRLALVRTMVRFSCKKCDMWL